MNFQNIKKTEDLENKLVSPFGPSILFTTVDKNIIETLKEVAENSRHDHLRANEVLVGNIDKEFALNFNESQSKIFQDLMIQKVEQYYNEKEQTEVKLIGAQFEHPWVNFQEANEFNPVHNHSGDLSYIIYLDIPNNVREEYTQSKVSVRGIIEFSFNNSFFKISPKTGDMIIFPSDLFHCVYPFESNETRISLAGNVNNPEIKILEE